MTVFGQQLAEFEMWAAVNEPAMAPAVSEVIDSHYRGRGFSGLAGLGDDTGDSSGVPGVTDLTSFDTSGLTSPSPSPAAANAASDTSNILTSLFSAAGNLVNNQAQAATRLQQLQATAAAQQAQASGAASTSNTMLMVGGVVAAVVVVALLAHSKQ